MDRIGHCIICHQDNVVLSDEHVIPEAIGGYYHIYSVCKECNSKLGTNVDKHLLNHWLIKAARSEHKLKGYSNTIPNPLIGDGVLPTGEKVRVEENKKGELRVHLLPTAPKVSADGHQFEISVDVQDEKDIAKIQNKLLKKNKIDPDKCQIVTQREVHQLEHPAVHMRFAIDLNLYKFGILKIAYEFAVDKVPGYYSDQMARLYADILHDGRAERLSEAHIEGNGIMNADLKLFESIIDYSKKKRHIMLLFNYKGQLYCMVKLFDTFCQFIRMSNCAYGNDNMVLLAINDFAENKCEFMSAEELIAAAKPEETTSYKLSDEGQALTNAEMERGEVGFACNKYSDNILYDALGNALCLESQLLLILEKLGFTKDETHTSEGMSTTYVVPLGYYYRLMPTGKLAMVKEITKKTAFNKI